MYAGFVRRQDGSKLRMIDFTTEQFNGALSLIRDGLQLSEQQTLLLLYQGELADAAECITLAAQSVGVRVDAREFSREDFHDHYPGAFSPDKLRTALPPQGIALLIEWSRETTLGRLLLLRDLMDSPQMWRVASMPGIDLEGLASCISDFDVIKDKCLNVLAVGARSHRAVLTTINPDGGDDSLVIPIGQYLPIISTGEIAGGSWGNFPSGETFMVPNVYQARGLVTVRGSIPLRPLRTKEWIRFEVKRGRIQHSSIEASSKPLKEQFSRLFFSATRRVICRNANALAELGVGTNPNIKHLTGKPILDEKKLGTAHISFGRNDQFHGPLNSCVHYDLVCTDCSLTFQSARRSYDLVHRGRFNTDRADAVPPLDCFSARIKTGQKVSAGGVLWDYRKTGGARDGQGTISVNYRTMREVIAFTIGDGITATIAYDMLQSIGRGPTTNKNLLSTLGCQNNQELCRRIINGLLEYGLLKQVK